ncbi:phosphonatase-like hydrolase [Tundrisphaera lichenicola]|uniref:phosphonatase-like hydrolase n=1 Tax=Tundrisphaera lichenicola TaxID=2029860 RepID=UPI003EB7089C
MAIELVVFDLAGTTVDDGGAVNRCLRDALKADGFEASPEAVDEVMGIAKPVAIRSLLGLEATDERVAKIFEDFVGRMSRFYATDPSVVEMPGATDVFRALRRAGVGVALDTGFSRDIVDILLDRLGWLREGLVDASITSDEVPRGRPHPDMIRSLMGKLGVAEASSVAKIGDTPSDLDEGSNAGCGLVIGFTSGTHTREQLAPYPHTHLIDALADLPDLVFQGSTITL